MAQLGHADDCPACQFESLPAEDKAVLEAAAFTVHTRREPPSKPPQSIGFLWGCSGVLIFFMLLAYGGCRRLHTVDRVITLGREANVESPDTVVVRNWDTDEPSERGIDGIERMRLVRDDNDRHVRTLLDELVSSAGRSS